jgi:hypothetical protein
MSDTDIEKAFLRAAEIAQKLPTNLQEAAFNRAIEQLLGSPMPSPTAPRGARLNSGPPRQAGGQTTRDITALIDSIDRTAYPDMGVTARVGDRALKVLHLANQDHTVDGLTAGEIATILSTKFRLPTKQNSVLKALERETDTVDVRGGAGASRVFHIMAPGEAYLAKLRSGTIATANPRPAKKAVAKTKQRSSAVSESNGGGTARPNVRDHKNTSGRKASGRPGPKAVLGQLLQAGFFKSPRTIATIQEELQHRRGHTYSVQELSPALVRSVRDQSLTRERNESGQYEYREA